VKNLDSWTRLAKAAADARDDLEAIRARIARMNNSELLKYSASAFSGA
jgi:hypothetical protein